MKLFKVISSSGELSRRKSIDAIQEAMVTVNGNLVLDPFVDIKEKDDIRLDNKKIKNNIELMTILLNKPQGYISTKSDEKGRKNINEVNLIKPMLIVVGSERNGVSSNLLKLSDEVGKIPIYGKTESLNAAVATGIILFEYNRQRHS